MGLKTFFKQLGPGLMLAGAAIGVSHLVQSTRAGAQFGYQLIPLIILTNLLKYPFFEIGHRYPLATNENIVQGYKRISPTLLKFIGLIGILATIITISGVFLVTAGLVHNFIPNSISIDLDLLCIFVAISCVGIVSFGKIEFLDNIMKFIMIFLTLGLVTAFFLSIFKVTPPEISPTMIPSPWNMTTLPFLLALMGWMPAPMELSVIQSLWFQQKQAALNKLNIAFSLKSAIREFNLGYYLTIILAIMFTTLGAKVLLPSGVQLSESTTTFSHQLISLFTKNFGAWSYYPMTIACFFTMLSTSLTCLDGYPRLIIHLTYNIYPSFKIDEIKFFRINVVFFSTIALLIILFFGDNIKLLIDIITILSFLMAPLFGVLNYKLIQSPWVNKKYQLSPFLKITSYLGILFLSLTAGFYLYSLLI